MGKLQTYIKEPLQPLLVFFKYLGCKNYEIKFAKSSSTPNSLSKKNKIIVNQIAIDKFIIDYIGDIQLIIDMPQSFIIDGYKYNGYRIDNMIQVKENNFVFELYCFIERI